MKSGCISALIIALLAPLPARACDYCLLQQGLSPLESMQGAGVRVSQRYTLLDSVYQGDDGIPNPGAMEEFWTTDFSAFFSPRAGWLLLANLPLRVTRVDGHLHMHDDGHDAQAHDAHGDADHDDGHGAEFEVHDDRGGDTGIGDLSLLARYTALQRHTLVATTLVAVSAGVKLPTGATNGRADDGEYLDAHTQLGTGSVDFLAGIAISHVVGRWSFAANALASFNGEGDAGDEDYEFGDALNYDVSARYRLLPATIGAGSTVVFASLGVAGELRGHEHAGGMRLGDSGGHVIYLVPALQVNAGPHWVFELSYREAMHHDLNATQLGESYKVFGSVNYLF